jgi:hypothetical protein
LVERIEWPFSNPKGFPIFVPDAVSFLDAQLNH